MSFILNEYDVDAAARRFSGDPVLGPATQTLANLVDVVNRNSDGWPYWKAPTKASVKLQRLIADATTNAVRGYGDEAVTSPEAVKAAYRPIKSFCTKHKLTVEFVNPT